MKTFRMANLAAVIALLVFIFMPSVSLAQPGGPQGKELDTRSNSIYNSVSLAQPGGPQGPQVVYPEVSADRHVTFRILAPKAEAVRLNGGDIPGVGQGAEMTKNADGVWETTLGPIDPGAYRYNFNMDGVSVIDPRSASISESNGNIWSLVYVTGADFMDAKNVPHGAVAEVVYFSSSLNRFRRMHIYTPPGY